MSFKLSYSAHLKVFGTIIDLENGNPMKGVWVKSFKNGICSDSMCTSSNGKYKLNLDNNDQYIIKFIKGGYVSKCFIVDTYGGEWNGDNSWVSLEVGIILFENIDIDTSIFDLPMGISRFIPLNGQIMWDKNYESRISPHIQYFMDKRYQYINP